MQLLADSLYIRIEASDSFIKVTQKTSDQELVMNLSTWDRAVQVYLESLSHSKWLQVAMGVPPEFRRGVAQPGQRTRSGTERSEVQILPPLPGTLEDIMTECQGLYSNAPDSHQGTIEQGYWTPECTAQHEQAKAEWND